jgi:hypothetical protein
MLESDSEGTEALATPSVEPDRWLKEGVPFAALARLERLNGSRIEHVHVRRDLRIERG